MTPVSKFIMFLSECKNTLNPLNILKPLTNITIERNTGLIMRKWCAKEKRFFAPKRLKISEQNQISS
jgi:hypothetical protein